MPPARSLLRRAVVTTGLLVLVGCGPDPGTTSEEQDDMTPEQAYTAMEDAVRAVLVAAGPDGEATISGPDDVPCGGLGGNEFSKIRKSVQGGGGFTTEAADAVFDKAEAAITDLGLEVRGRSDVPVGPTLGFSGDGFVVTLILRSNGGLTASGETACLPNPDR